MTAPATVIAPAYPRTAHGQELDSRMAFMVATNELLVGARKPEGLIGALSERELRAQERFYLAGKTPEAFVRHVRARRCRWCARRTPGYRRKTGFCSDICNMEQYGAAHREDI